MGEPIRIDQFQRRGPKPNPLQLTPTIDKRRLIEELIPAVLVQLRSPHSKRMYGPFMERFVHSGYELSRDGLLRYREHLEKRGNANNTINLHMAACRKLIIEAADRGLLAEGELKRINRTKLAHTQMITGHWLTLAGAKRLVGSVDRNTTVGKRDAAIFALTLGAGLRREEAVEFKWAQYVERDGRKVLLNIVGKGRKVRTVPISPWAELDLDDWKAETSRVLGITDPVLAHSHVLRRVRKAVRDTRGRLNTPEALERVLAEEDEGENGQKLEPMRIEKPTLADVEAVASEGKLTAQGLWWIVRQYADRLGIEISPHDMRRSLAQMMRRAGVPLEQIQYQLGHAELKTTELYLGGTVELLPGKAGVDQIEWDK